MRGHTVAATSDFVAPPLNYTAGAIVFGAFAGYPGTADEGSYVLYAAQTAGPEPLSVSGSGSSADDLSERKKSLTVEVLRFVTDDLRSFRTPTVCLKFKTGGDPYPYTLPTVKSMARNSRSGELIMVVLGLGQAINVCTYPSNLPVACD